MKKYQTSDLAIRRSTLKVMISQRFAYKFLEINNAMTMGTFGFTCPGCTSASLGLPARYSS